jgi:hypothetical protein
MVSKTRKMINVNNMNIHHSVGTKPTYRHSVISQKKEISQFKVIKDTLWSSKKTL